MNQERKYINAHRKKDNSNNNFLKNPYGGKNTLNDRRYTEVKKYDRNKSFERSKRKFSNDTSEEPPSKKPFHGTPRSCDAVPSPSSTKNIAAKRLQNLRNSLEIKVANERSYHEDVRTSCSPVKSPFPSYLNTSGDMKTVANSTNNIKNQYKIPVHRNKCAINKVNVNRFDNFSRFKKVESKSLNIVQTPKVETIVQSKRKMPSDEACSSNTRIEVTNNNQEASTSKHVDTMEEEMDWSPINESEVIQNLNSIREGILNNRSSRSLQPLCSFIDATTYSTKELYLVVDSNIFLLNLKFINKIEEVKIKRYENVIIFVPWIVLEELDYIKNGNSKMGNLQKTAQKAVRYINSKLVQKNSKFKGQTILDASRLNISSSNPDDSIIFCCMQLIEKNNHVILLSNDINLRNKALIHKIKSHSHSEILEKLNNFNANPSDTKDNEEFSIVKLKSVLNELLTFIITEEMRDGFGDIWIKVIHIKPPFTLEECLINMKKHWLTIFSFKLQKQCRMCIEEFLDFIKNNRNDTEYSQKQYNKFMEFSLRTCIFLKNSYQVHLDKINKCIYLLQTYAT